MAIKYKVKQILDFGKKSRTGAIIMAEIATGAALALVSLWAFAQITDEVVEKETAAFDTAVQAAVYSLRSESLTGIMTAISFLGSKEFLFWVSLALIAFFCVKNKRRAAITYAAILLLSAGLNNLIKLIIHRDRPQLLPLEETTFFSFPSGHSMNSLVFYGLLAYFAYHYAKNKALGLSIYIIAVLITVLIGFSRIYLGAHYPTDVIAGFVAGMLILSAAIVIHKTLVLKKLFDGAKR